MSEISLPLYAAISIVILVLLASFFVGRRTGASAARIRDLEGELDASLQERERLEGEITEYRGKVADHFAETSQRLHELTVQYRAVYDHLAQGANELCPEGFEQLEGGLGLDALLPEAEDREEEAAEEAPRETSA